MNQLQITKKKFHDTLNNTLRDKIIIGALTIIVYISYILITYPTLMLLMSFIKSAPIPTSFMLFALLMSMSISWFSTQKSRSFFLLSETSTRLFLVLIPFFLFMIGLFILRDNFGIYDIFYPTDLLGMSERAREGLLPLSFTSFPDFPANYHQAFLILVGGLARITQWTTLYSLVFLFPALSLFILIYVFFATSKAEISPWITFVTILIFFFSTSLPEIHSIQQGSSYEYLLFLDIYFSNSWVLGTLATLMMALFFWQKNQLSTLYQKWPVLLILFCLISINASLFMAAWVSLCIMASIECFMSIKNRKYNKKSFLILFILIIIYYSSHFIPSAFLMSPHYNEVITRIKYFNAGLRTRDIKESLELLRLIGPWILLLPYALNLRKISFSQLLFLFAICFPVCISLENVDRWDAIHKFAVTGMIAGFLFLIQLLREKRVKKQCFCCFAIISILLSSHYLYNFATTRLSSFHHAFWNSLPDTQNQDFIRYFQSQKQPIKIHPVYQMGGCDIGTLASFSGTFMANAYYPGFLVNIDRIDWPSEDHWSSANNFSDYLQKTHANGVKDVIVIEKTKNNDFLKMIQIYQNNVNFKIHINTMDPIIFKHYILYNYTL